MAVLAKPPTVSYPKRYIIDLVPCFAALFGGPLLFTAMTFALVFVMVVMPALRLTSGCGSPVSK